MKKISLIAALGVAGLMSAKNSVETEKNLKVECLVGVKAIFYDPIIPITSSCGYTEYIDLAGSPISCIEVEINRMEEECDAPFEGWGYAYNGYS
ncbi:hypothetical protein [Chryseobacterium daecheongense]|nr:hypothetical protein [Chryseobacterium daecheongense]TDX92088.1 hypothetical protein BCF50_3230 [Chryseobacterium daecheongense]